MNNTKIAESAWEQLDGEDKIVALELSLSQEVISRSVNDPKKVREFVRSFLKLEKSEQELFCINHTNG